MSQIEDMLRMIKKHRDAGVTRVSVKVEKLERNLKTLFFRIKSLKKWLIK
jgi:hypothetical protein